MNSVDKMIPLMRLAGEKLNTQFHNKVEEYKTLEHNKKNCILETYN